MDYSSLKPKELLAECKKRKIKECENKTRMTKKKLIELLENHDAVSKGSSPKLTKKSSSKIQYIPITDVDLTEISDNNTKNQNSTIKKLFVGISHDTKSNYINTEFDDFTGNRNPSNNTIQWVDIVINKKYDNEYDEIIIVNIDPFISPTGVTILKDSFNMVLKTLKHNGSVLLADDIVNSKTSNLKLHSQMRSFLSDRFFNSGNINIKFNTSKISFDYSFIIFKSKYNTLIIGNPNTTIDIPGVNLGNILYTTRKDIKTEKSWIKFSMIKHGYANKMRNIVLLNENITSNQALDLLRIAYTNSSFYISESTDIAIKNIMIKSLTLFDTIEGTYNGKPMKFEEYKYGDNVRVRWAPRGQTIDLASKYKILEKKDKKSPKKKLFSSRKYTLMEPIGIDYTPTNSNKEPKSKLKITVADFLKELNKPEFLEQYKKSQQEFLETKKRLYIKRINDLQKENDKFMKDYERMKSMNIRESLDTLFPLYSKNAILIVKLDDLYNTIEERIGKLDVKVIKKDLLEAINDEEYGLASIVGRDEIKSQLISLIYAFSQNYKSFINSFNNMALLGPAGIGKTKLAMVVGYMFSKSGILLDDHVKIVTQSDLVAQYVGHTAPQTRSVLMSALEGILFIDEAYQLAGGSHTTDRSSSFGREAITEIVNFLDKYIGMIIVIVAGYEGLMMKVFFPANEGLLRRFPYRMILSPYSNAELTDILIRTIETQSGLKIEKELSNFLYSMIVKLQLNHPDVFSNQAGDMLNLGSSIVKSIFSTYKVKWEEGDFTHNLPIILEGFDDYLITKGLSRE